MTDRGPGIECPECGASIPVETLLVSIRKARDEVLRQAEAGRGAARTLTFEDAVRFMMRDVEERLRREKGGEGEAEGN